MRCNCSCIGEVGATFCVGDPIINRNFVAYPCTLEVNVLAKYGLCKVVFPEVVDSDSPVSLMGEYSNDILFKINGDPLLAKEVKPGIPTKITYNSYVGGYVASGYGAIESATSTSTVVPTKPTTTPSESKTK